MIGEVDRFDFLILFFRWDWNWSFLRTTVRVMMNYNRQFFLAALHFSFFKTSIEKSSCEFLFMQKKNSHEPIEVYFITSVV